MIDKEEKMKPNKLRELLNAKKPTLGTHMVIPWPRLVEVYGHTGAFNYIEYIGEYSTYTLEQFENLGRAFELFPNMSSMIKVEEHTRGFIATRALDAGIQNVLFADCRDAKDVKECVRMVRPETPEAGGTHGAGGRRVFLGSNTVDWVKGMDDVVIAFMIEKKSAIDDLENILNVKGVSMIQFGPNDYSLTLGKPGQLQIPEVRKTHMDMIKMALKKGIAPRVEINGAEEAKPFIEMGVRHFCIGWDTIVISQWCQQQAEDMQKLLC
jgi:4-hydroxy-2-oxoheptanedioate aldolase